MLQRSTTPKSVPAPLTTDGWSGYRPPSQSATDALIRKTAMFALARPWIDQMAERVLHRYYFPLSRMWAAASLAHGSPERFFATVPMTARSGSRDRVLKTLALYEQAHTKSKAMDATWENVFFKATQTHVDERIASEAARIELRHAFGATRRHFYFLTWSDVPRVNYQTPTPEDVDAVYGAALDDFEPFVAAPDPMPHIEVSQRLPATTGTDYWLRFKSPSDRLGDTVYARVLDPDNISDPPTIIFGHGVCVEFDHWQGLIDEAEALRARGFRVIRPEAPWHGRRTPEGRYGGEHLIATFPIGPLDMLTGAAREWAVLSNWARANSNGPLAFGGSSLGALTAQFVAEHASNWPKHLRPDALFLITHCRGLFDAINDGQLVSVWGDESLFDTGGWNRDRVASYLTLLDCKGDLSVPPKNIVSVLGSRDAVTPFSSGRTLVKRWGVPQENLFVWDRGHFSVPMTLKRMSAPLDRFCRIMGVKGKQGSSRTK